MIFAAALFLAAVSAQSAQLPDAPPTLLGDYTSARAMRMWGAINYCSPPDSDGLLRLVDARLASARARLVRRFGAASVEQAEVAANAQFDEEMRAVGAGRSCLINDAAADRANLTNMRRDYDRLLAPLEDALAAPQPSTTDTSGQPTLYGLYENALWGAYPGCLCYQSRHAEARYKALVERLRATRPTLVAQYGADAIDQFERQHADDAHGIYYTRCPEVDYRFNQQLRRSIETLERLATRTPAEG